MRVAITGSSGLIGTALREFFHARGDEVTRIVRSRSPKGGGPEVVWSVERGVIDTAGLEDHDLVVHLAGESVAGVWTPDKKRKIRESRVTGTTLLSDALASLTRRPAAYFSASGMNFYGNRAPSEPITEASPAGVGFLAEVAREWEHATMTAAEAGIRVVHMRSGNVLSPKGGMLPALLPLFRLGLGAKFGDGKQIWPWIALDDYPAAVVHVYEKTDLAGPVNFVAPEAVSNEQFTNTLAAAIGRFAFFAVPAFAARLAPGGMADEILLGGARLIPARLLESGYEFKWPELKPFLRNALGEPG
jgi:hypothetical protein